MPNIFEKPNYKNYSMRYAKDFGARKILWQQLVCQILMRTLLILFYNVKIVNRENIPKGRFIVAPNHTCYFDPFVSVLIIKKCTAFMAKKELFEKNWLGSFLLDELAAFAVNREHLEISTIKTVKEIFKTDNWSMGIFPEGGIRRNKQLSKITKGFAVIAQMVKCDILPIGIAGLESYNWNPFKKKDVTISIGTIISHQLSIDEIIDNWKNQVGAMNNYEVIPSEPEAEKEQKEEAPV